MESLAQVAKSHNPRLGRIVNWLTGIVVVLVLVIGTIAFVLSFDALRDIAAANGLDVKSWLFPWLIDLPLVVFTIALLVAQLTGQRVRFWVGLVALYTLATVVFNIAHAQPTGLGYLVAITPPVGLLLSTEALRHLAKTIIEQTAAVLTLADLRSLATTAAGRVDALRIEADTLAGKVEGLKAEVRYLRKEKRSYDLTEIGEDTTAAALVVLAERPDITGSELGRTLGKSASLGRRLKRELVPVVPVNGNGHGGGTL